MLHSTQMIRAAAIVFAAVVFGETARADGYNPSADPFVQRTTNQGEVMTSNYFGNRYSDYSPYHDFTWDQQFSGIRFRQVTTVPLLPPVLGDELPVAGGLEMESPALADFARETFYGPYTAFLLENKLSARNNDRLAAYRTRRQQLVREIQLKFEELTGATPAARIASLNQFAEGQEASLRTLSAEAESIRSDFARAVSFYGFNLVVSDGSFWGTKSAGEARDLFAAAYYDAGASTEQRLLLPEIVYDLSTTSSGAKSQVLEGKSDYIYFLPATSRIRLPANLPPGLQEKISAFTREKESLKSELRTAVLRKNYFFGWQRTKRFMALAEQQAPRFAALGVLAEEIRIGLAAFPYPVQPAGISLPTDLTERVGNFYARKVEVQREIMKRLRNLNLEFPEARFQVARQGDGLGIVVTKKSANAPDLTEYNASLASRYTAFKQESEVLRRDIQHYTETTPNHATRTVDQLAGDFEKAYRAQENWNRYRDYYRAVLEPGLSPAQRQLLFRAATAELDQGGKTTQS